MRYQPEHLDFTLSPYTGLTREHWVSIGKYLLEGAFSALKDKEDPPVLPRSEYGITYPHLRDPMDQQRIQKKAEIFEGLCRSFFIASVLIREDPQLNLSGIVIREYYKEHILRALLKKDSAEYVGDYEEIRALAGDGDPFRPYQQTVETGGLVIGLFACREVLWETYTTEEKDGIASFIEGYAKANTVPNNWRLFNMLALAFLHENGYPVKRELMAEHAASVLSWYAGDGWYRDGQCFDYYSCWAFNLYGPLWCDWYGYREMPEVADLFERNSNRLMESFPDMFDRDGFVNMWGRSMIYRNAVTGALGANFFLKNPAVSPGLARRISSGALLQFVTRDDFLINGIPSLGFYGQFTPLVQPYSCAESPYWLGKAFLCLYFPKEHPFWNTPEENGSWEKLKKNEVRETVLNGPGLVITDHQANGEAILRSAKVVKEARDPEGIWNYAKLCYNTKYPWEAGISGRTVYERPLSERTPEEDPKGAAEGLCPLDDGVDSQQYVLKSLTNGKFERANVTFYGGVREGVLYRKQFFDFGLTKEWHWMEAVELADFPVPLGILRADRLIIPRRPMEILLGAYGFPDNGTEVEEKREGEARALILKGKDHTGRPRRLAMTIFGGFSGLGLKKRKGTNPDSEYSLVVYAKGELKRQYDASEPYIFLSQVITLDEDREFTEQELFPVGKIIYGDSFLYGTGGLGALEFYLKDGTGKRIDYSGITGRLSL